MPNSAIDLGNKILAKLQEDSLKDSTSRKSFASDKKPARSARANDSKRPGNQSTSKQNNGPRKSKNVMSSKLATSEKQNTLKGGFRDTSTAKPSASQVSEGIQHSSRQTTNHNEEMNDREVLLEEIKKFGGTEEDFRLLTSFSSSEEEEIQEESTEDPQLARDLKEFMKELNFSAVTSSFRSVDDLPRSNASSNTESPQPACQQKRQVDSTAEPSVGPPEILKKNKKRNKK